MEHLKAVELPYTVYFSCWEDAPSDITVYAADEDTACDFVWELFQDTISSIDRVERYYPEMHRI